jgi:hypothetical protein
MSTISTPPPAGPEREEWLVRGLQTTHALAVEAHDGIARIERSIGQSPDAAKGVEGSGLLGVLHVLVTEREFDRRKWAWLRTYFAGFASAIGVAAVLIGLLKALKIIPP